MAESFCRDAPQVEGLMTMDIWTLVFLCKSDKDEEGEDGWSDALIGRLGTQPAAALLGCYDSIVRDLIKPT